jgi:hypothetical protein
LASPACQVSDNGGAYVLTTNGVDVSAGDTISVQLLSTAGVNLWTLACVGTDETSTAPSISLTGPGGNTRQFAAGGLGTTYRFQSQINNGYDKNGNWVPSWTTTFGVYVRATSGNRVMAVNEGFESHALAGWTSIVNPVLRSIGGGSASASNKVYTSNTILTAQVTRAQWAPVNTAGGPFTLTLPSPIVQPYQIGVSDVGGAVGTNALLIDGNGVPVFNPTGPHAGTLQSTYSMNVPLGSFSFALTPADPANVISTAPFWMVVGDGIYPFAPNGVLTGNTTLLGSQWAPVNTVGGPFTLTLPSVSFGGLQVMATDTGFACDAKPLTVNGGAFQILNPSGPNQGTLTQTFLMNQRGETLVFQLVPADVTNPLTTRPFWTVI